MLLTYIRTAYNDYKVEKPLIQSWIQQVNMYGKFRLICGSPYHAYKVASQCAEYLDSIKQPMKTYTEGDDYYITDPTGKYQLIVQPKTLDEICKMGIY